MPPHAQLRGPRSSLTVLFHMSDPFPYMLRLAKEYGDPLTCPMPGQAPMVLLAAPERIKEVFSAPHGTFDPSAAEALAVIVGSGSIFLTTGDPHRRQRKLLSPPFHGERMRGYAELMHATALRWARARKRGVSEPLLSTAQGITLDIIVEAIFGERDQARVARLHEDILGLVDAFHPLIAMFRFMQQDFGGIGPWAKFKRRADALHGRMRTLIEEKRASAGEDVLSLLLSMKDESGEGLGEQEILEQLLTFVIAGHETTATTLAWAMYELHRAPEALAKLRAELAALGPSAPPEVIARQPYLSAVIQETLRMHPPVPIVPRKTTGEFRLGEHVLPAGTVLGVAVYTAHFREETYPEPHAFRPERFVERSYSPFEFLPFGGGARRCLGAAFASFELAIALAAMLSVGTYRLDEPRPLRTVFRIGTYGPEHGVRMTLLDE